MKLNHAQPETVNRAEELRRPMGVGSGDLLGVMGSETVSDDSKEAPVSFLVLCLLR
jgi:hypothetical protein